MLKVSECQLRHSTSCGCCPSQTLVFELYGILGLLVQTVVLRVMLRAVGEVYVLLTGLCFEVVRLLLLGFAQAKYQARQLVLHTLPHHSFGASEGRSQ